MAVKERIKKLLEQLNTGIYEKEQVMALALLSSIAGESIFLLGPPGVAKSLIARRLKYAYKDAEVFEYLMSRFSTPDEIFGPVAISKLKKDKYERIVENYLPSADVVFLDEIWKAGPSIQNALLTILNEKIFRNGEKEIKVPMKALISASNELPAKDQGLEALWDRFLVRLIVEGIEGREQFNTMITMPQNLFDENVDGGITVNEYEDWSKKIDQIAIPENVSNIIHVIRNKLELHNQNEENVEKQIYVSDRRWRKIVRLMRTSAFVNDRSEVDLMDCFLIKHCIWDEEDKIQAVSGFVNDAIEDYGYILKVEFSSTRTKEVIEGWISYLEIEIKEKTKDLKVGPKTGKIYADREYTFEEWNAIHKPPPEVEEEWDICVIVCLQYTSKMKDQLEQYRNKDLEHLRTNLFVKPELAAIVESHITKTRKDIEKIELEIREIQHNYKKFFK